MPIWERGEGDVCATLPFKTSKSLENYWKPEGFLRDFETKHWLRSKMHKHIKKRNKERPDVVYMLFAARTN